MFKRSAPSIDALIVGAGPAGLAAAYGLGRRGVHARILDRADTVGSSWRSHYDTLALNSGRVLSSLPGMLIDRSYGKWVRRDDFIDYLTRYAAALPTDIEHGVMVERVDRTATGWQVSTSAGARSARAVIMATGLNSTPAIPPWAVGRLSNNVFHSDQYRTAQALIGREVLVVGGGSTAHDIALAALRGGASRVRSSVRTPPLLTPRRILGVSSTILSIMIKHGPRLPAWILDPLSIALHRACFPSANRLLGAPPSGLHTALRERGHGLTVENGLLDAVRRGDIEILPETVGIDDDGSVQLAGGTRLRADVVILATGHRPALSRMVGHLGVLGEHGRPLAHGATCLPQAPHLHFLGYRLPAGQLSDLRIDAHATARHLARDR